MVTQSELSVRSSRMRFSPILALEFFIDESISEMQGILRKWRR